MPFGRVLESFVEEPFPISCFMAEPRAGPGGAQRPLDVHLMLVGPVRHTETARLGKGHSIPSPLWGGQEEKEGTGKGGQSMEGRNKVVRREAGLQGWCQDSFLPQLPGHPLWADIVQGAWDPDMVPSQRASGGNNDYTV